MELTDTSAQSGLAIRRPYGDFLGCFPVIVPPTVADGRQRSFDIAHGAVISPHDALDTNCQEYEPLSETSHHSVEDSSLDPHGDKDRRLMPTTVPYSRLQNIHSTRILRLLPGADDDVLCCTLIEQDLHSQVLKYEAISYGKPVYIVPCLGAMANFYHSGYSSLHSHIHLCEVSG